MSTNSSTPQTNPVGAPPYDRSTGAALRRVVLPTTRRAPVITPSIQDKRP